MTPEQAEILRNAYGAFLHGEIDREQYNYIRLMIADEMMENYGSKQLEGLDVVHEMSGA